MADKDTRKEENNDIPTASGLEEANDGEVAGELFARHAEISTMEDLTKQRGTPIPALYNQFYKFIQNPSTVSVETFKRMIDTDDTIGSGVDFLITCLAARLGDYQHPVPEIAKWVNQSLKEMDGGWVNNVKNALSAAWSGFFVGEKVWANTDRGFVIKKIAPLPPGTILFETDRVGEITPDGILQYQRNYNPALFSTGTNYLFGNSFGFASSNGSGGGIRPDQNAKYGDLPFPLRTANTYSYLSIRIPRIKCFHYAFDAQGRFGNPYGRSLLRRAYKWYVMKDAFLTMLSIALDRKGTPLTVVFANQNTTLNRPAANNEGRGAAGRDTPGQGIRADVAARDAFKNVHNDSVIILPGKRNEIFDVEMVDQQSNADVFISSIDLCNKSIMRALLIPSLIFTNGDGTGSFALGQEHAKTFDKILDGMLSGFNYNLIEQVVRELVAYNFPKEVWIEHGLGEFGKREVSAEEKEAELKVIQTAVDVGAVDMNDLNDLNQVREKAGFQARTTPIPQPAPVNPFDETAEGDQTDDGYEGEVDDFQEDLGDESSPKGKKLSRVVNWTVKAVLTFDDGQNKGNLTVRATDAEDAKKVAIERLKQIWRIDERSIEILSVKKG